MTARRGHLFAVGSVLAGLWALGAPWPSPDDVFYIGAAMNLAGGGPLENPFIAPWMAPLHTTRFFVHPPLPSYALAAWLKAFGVSGLSLHAFQWAACAVSVVALDALLRRFSIRHVSRAVVEIVLLFALVSRGLRFEPIAFAFALSGLAVLGLTPVKALLGLFLISCAVQSVPWIVTFALPFGAAVLLHDLQRRQAGRLGWRGAAVVIMMVMVAGASLLGAMIDFQFVEFFRVLLAIVADLSEGPRENWAISLQLATQGWQSVLVLPTFILFGMCGLDLCFRASPSGPWPLAAAAMAASLMGATAYAVRVAPFLLVFAWLTIVVWAETRRPSRALCAVLGAALGLNHAMLILFLAVGSFSPRPDAAAIKAEMSSLPEGTPLLIDSVAARFVFDYRLPPGTTAWEFSRPFREGYPRAIGERAPGTVWVIQRHNDLMGTAMPARLLGRDFQSINAAPYAIAVWK